MTKLQSYAEHNRYYLGAYKMTKMIYQIRLQGHLGHQWTDWFGGLTIILEENGDTLLTGPVIDQTALHSLLRKVRDLGMPLLSVNRLKPGQADVSDFKQSSPNNMHQY